MREYDQGIEKKILSIEKEISSLDDFANKYVIEGIFGLTPKQFFQEINETLIDFFTNHINIKFRMVLVCIMEKQTTLKTLGITSIDQAKSYFSSETRYVPKATNIKKLIKEIIDSFINSIDSYSVNGSGWSFKEVEKLEIHTVVFNPAKGSSYIDLPSWLKNKKAIVNIKNKDKKCFLWCVLRHLYPKERDQHRLTDLKKYEFSLNTKGINFPMKLKDISKFEKLNPSLPGINVFFKR